MNREILFRGKRVDNGEWVEGLPCYDVDGSIAEIEVFWGYLCCDTNEVIPETVGEYTGLTDKNGKKIFEGDIVKVNDEIVVEINTEAGYDCDSWDSTAHFLIGWDKEEAAFRIIGSNYGEDLCYSQFYYDVSPDGNGENFIEELSRRAEIVGNVHDNPELLEVSK